MKSLFILFFFTLMYSQTFLDGKIFDSGLTLKEASQHAPKEISLLNDLIGQWDVRYTTYNNDTVQNSAEGLAYIHFMNRGHHLMERMHISNFDNKNNELNIVSFIAYSIPFKKFNIGEGNSFTESIRIFDGSFNNKTLELNTSIRVGGSVNNTLIKRTISLNKDRIISNEKTSTDYGKTWQKSVDINYSRRGNQLSFFKENSIYGSYQKDQIDEKREFDFLLGEFNATHDFLFPNGQRIKFPINATAIHFLNGHGILEYSWNDVDKNNPDASTTILRLYNRAMRRWESLYITNRSGNNLYFGGKKEGNDIVLTLFDANSSFSSINYFVFHNIKKDEYHWYSHLSTDRYGSFVKNWIIDFKRK
jgi:hypothetical protein